MNEPTVFTKGMWRVRAAVTEFGPVFVAADVCNVLGLGNPTDALKRLDDDERTLVSIEGASNGLPVNAITEAGLYCLVLGSRKPEAREFKRWVTHDVLPTLRKHGVYATPAAAEQMLNNPDFLISTLQALKAERTAKEQAQAALTEAQPAIEFHAAVTNSDDTLSVGEVAKLLNVGFGEVSLFKWLRSNNILMNLGKNRRNLPYQKYMDAGYFRVVERQGWQDSYGCWHPTYQTRVTQRGVAYIQRRLSAERRPS